MRFLFAFQGFQGKIEAVHCFVDVDTYTVKSRAGLFGVWALYVPVARAFCAQCTVGEGKSEVFSTQECFSLEDKRYLLGLSLVAGMDDDAAPVPPQYFFILPWQEGTGTGGTGVIFPPISATEHAFEECAGIKYDILNGKDHCMIRSQ